METTDVRGVVENESIGSSKDDHKIIRLQNKTKSDSGKSVLFSKIFLERVKKSRKRLKKKRNRGRSILILRNPPVSPVSRMVSGWVYVFQYIKM